MVLEYLSIEFIGHLCPWNYHEILDVHSPNDGMPHLLFLVAMRALRIYSSRRSFSSISPKEPLSIFKPKATELITGFIEIEIISSSSSKGFAVTKQRGYHHVCGLHGEYDHYPNHRVRPNILLHSAPSLWINGRGLPTWFTFQILKCWSRITRVPLCVAAPYLYRTASLPSECIGARRQSYDGR